MAGRPAGPPTLNGGTQTGGSSLPKPFGWGTELLHWIQGLGEISQVLFARGEKDPNKLTSRTTWEGGKGEKQPAASARVTSLAGMRLRSPVAAAFGAAAAKAAAWGQHSRTSRGFSNRPVAWKEEYFASERRRSLSRPHRNVCVRTARGHEQTHGVTVSPTARLVPAGFEMYSEKAEDCRKIRTSPQLKS